MVERPQVFHHVRLFGCGFTSHASRCPLTQHPTRQDRQQEMKRGYRAAALYRTIRQRSVVCDIYARARRCGGSASAGVLGHPWPPLMERARLLPLTTTTKSWPAASTIAWPSVLWVGRLLPAGVAAVLLSMDCGGVRYFHWLTGGIGICMTYHRLLTHRSFAIRPRWLEYVLTAIGCCASEGGPIGWAAAHRNHHARTRTTSMTFTAPTWFCLGPYALVDDTRCHLASHPRVLPEVVSSDLYKNRVYRRDRQLSACVFDR